MLPCGGAAEEINIHQTAKINTFITQLTTPRHYSMLHPMGGRDTEAQPPAKETAVKHFTTVSV